jgi:hypothetical protein
MGTQPCRAVPKGTSVYRAIPCHIKTTPRVFEETKLPVASSSSPSLSQQTEAAHPHRLHGAHVVQGLASGHLPPPLRAPTRGDVAHRRAVGLASAAVMGTRAPLTLQVQLGPGESGVG